MGLMNKERKKKKEWRRRRRRRRKGCWWWSGYEEERKKKQRKSKKKKKLLVELCKRRKKERKRKKISMTQLLNNDKSGKWVPQFDFFTILPLQLILHNLKTPKLMFSVFITQTQIFEFEWYPSLKNQAKQFVFYGSYEFWMISHENWVICVNPNSFYIDMPITTNCN